MTTPLSPDLVDFPLCGAVYPLEKVAGEPVICDKAPHPASEMHLNCETGFAWWSC